jgi:uncharacterized protein YceK
LKGRHTRSNKKRIVIVAAGVFVLILAVSLVVLGCGSKSTTNSGGTGNNGTQQMTGNPEIDNDLRQLDQQMNSVDVNDFDENQLSNSALGF